jgi:hypothetical protein
VYVGEAGLALCWLAPPALIDVVSASDDGEAASSGFRHEHANYGQGYRDLPVIVRSPHDRVELP